MSSLIESGKVALTPVGATFLGEITYEEMETFVGNICQFRRMAALVLGDALNFSEQKWGETYAQLEVVTGYDPGYLRNLKYVCGKVPIENRVINSFSFLQAVAPLDVHDQRMWLETAIEKGWTRDELRKAISPPDNQETITLVDLAIELVYAYENEGDISIWVEKIRDHLRR